MAVKSVGYYVRIDAAVYKHIPASGERTVSAEFHERKENRCLIGENHSRKILLLLVSGPIPRCRILAITAVRLEFLVPVHTAGKRSKREIPGGEFIAGFQMHVKKLVHIKTVGREFRVS